MTDGKLGVNENALFYYIFNYLFAVDRSEGSGVGDKVKDKWKFSVLKSPRSPWVSEGSHVIIYEAQITKQKPQGTWPNTLKKQTHTSLLLVLVVFGCVCDHFSPPHLIAVAPTLTAVSSDPTDVSTHILWISALLAYLSVFLAVYIYR